MEPSPSRYSHTPVLTLALVLSSQLLGDVLLLQVQEPLLLLFHPAEPSSPECRVLLHQSLNSDLWVAGAVVVFVHVPVSLSLRGFSSLAVYVVVLDTSQTKINTGGDGDGLTARDGRC